MLVTLKTVVPLMVYVMFNHNMNPTLLFALSALLLVAMTLFLLPRFKGMIVAFQWAKRMHGFGDDAKALTRQSSVTRPPSSCCAKGRTALRC